MLIRNFYLITYLFFYLSVNSFSQVQGGDVFVKQLNSTQFSIQIKLVAYCNDTLIPDSIGSSSTSSEARIFDSGNDTLIRSISSSSVDSIISISHGDACYTPPGLCSKAYYYSTIITLPSSSKGYYFTWKINNRSFSENILGSNPIVFFAEFSQDIIMPSNSLPTFNLLPSKGYGCIGYITSLDFSCEESDGDSLVYSIVEPVTDFNFNGSKPIYSTNYTTGITKPLGLGSYCTINSSTGMVKIRLAQLGLFSLTVKCEEYRAGVKISEVYKDHIFASLNCTLGFPIYFRDFPTTYEFEYGKKNCFDVVAQASDPFDSIFLTIQSDAIRFGLSPQLPKKNMNGKYDFQWRNLTSGYFDTVNNLSINQLSNDLFDGIGRIGTRVCWNLMGCNKFPDKEYTVSLQVTRDRCGLKDTANEEIKIRLIDKDAKKPYSFVLSPNGDGVNDVFRIVNNENNKCFTFGAAKIYALTGQEIYNTDNPNSIWDGTNFIGENVASGVYMVSVSGKYGSKNHIETYKILLVR